MKNFSFETQNENKSKWKYKSLILRLPYFFKYMLKKYYKNVTKNKEKVVKNTKKYITK